MKEPDDEDVASHIGPESCEGVGNGALEALTGVRAGWVLSLERSLLRSADAFRNVGRPRRTVRQRENRPNSAGSQTPDTHGHTSRTGGVLFLGGRNLPRGSREIPCSARRSCRVRIVNPKGAIR
jgi:hypothetical protein